MAEIIRTIIVMSVSGSILALLMFAVKPLIKNRLPKSAQYCLWLVAVAALLAPVSKFVHISQYAEHIPPAAVYDIVQWNVITSEEETERFDAVVAENPLATELPGGKNPITGIVDISTILYPFGVIAVLLCHILAYTLFLRKIRRHNIPADIACFIPVYRNATASAPMLIGLLSPAIVLPDEEYTDEQLRAVLQHELTHLGRKDVLVKWLSVLACSVHWFNPIVWLTRREIDRACELACDEAVIRSLDASGRQTYGDMLIYVSADCKTPRAVLSTTMCEDKKDLKERLGAIMRPKKHTRAAVIASAAVIAAAVLAACALGAGSETPAPAYDPDFVFENRFEIKPSPDKYTPAMSSTPGIILGYEEQGEGGLSLTYACDSGTFGTWEDSKVTVIGDYAEQDFGEPPRLHWTPDNKTANGDRIRINLIKDGQTVYAQALAVETDGMYYSLAVIAPDQAVDFDTDTSNLETAVSLAILNHADASSNGGYQTESHVTLKAVQDGGRTTVYAYALSMSYVFENGRLTEDSGSSAPVAITFSKDAGGAYSLVEYWMPQDGSYYTPSIQEKFPKDLWDKADTQLYVSGCAIAALRTAQRHFGLTDTAKPEVAVLKPLEIPNGTKPDWNEYFSITDDTDGIIPLSEAHYWDTVIDFDKPGKYNWPLIVRDKAGNENRSSYEITIK
jgi:beta-lactamase regulating signal transducer with metallopeptidase domain